MSSIPTKDVKTIQHHWDQCNNWT